MTYRESNHAAVHDEVIMPLLHSVEEQASHSAAHTDPREVAAYPILAYLPIELSAGPSKLPAPRHSDVLVGSESQTTLCH